MRHREITNEQVLTAFMNVVAEERESMRKELQQKLDEEWRSALDEELRQLWSALLLEFEEKRSALQSKVEKGLEQLQSAYQDKLRTLGEENRKLRGENSELRALCAELREARGLLDFIKTQCAPDRPPQ